MNRSLEDLSSFEYIIKCFNLLKLAFQGVLRAALQIGRFIGCVHASILRCMIKFLHNRTMLSENPSQLGRPVLIRNATEQRNHKGVKKLRTQVKSCKNSRKKTTNF